MDGKIQVGTGYKRAQPSILYGVRWLSGCFQGMKWNRVVRNNAEERRYIRQAENILPINNKFLILLLDLQPGEGKKRQKKISTLCVFRYGLLRLVSFLQTRHVAQKRHSISSCSIIYRLLLLLL